MALSPAFGVPVGVHWAGSSPASVPPFHVNVVKALLPTRISYWGVFTASYDSVATACHSACLPIHAAGRRLLATRRHAAASAGPLTTSGAQPSASHTRDAMSGKSAIGASPRPNAPRSAP